ncbi:MAG: DUF1501 domain-containing protein [Candidatus Rokubacteria bacterium]|nr:DUF1501 domain-containing protein [Candidatus Rokubacteria bacterium]
MTRRAFAKQGAVALVAFGLAPRFLLRTARAAPGEKRGRVLVAIFQRGAADGLNIVVPHRDPDYARARPRIAIPEPSRGGEDRALDLDGFFGLHPSLAPLRPLWERRELACVHAVGSPDATRSHFDAQDFMETGTPGVRSTPDGWLNRCLQHGPAPAEASVFRGVALAPILPRSLHGAVTALALPSLEAFDLGGSSPEVRQGFESLYRQAVQDFLGGTGQAAFDAVKRLRAARPTARLPEHGAVYPKGRLGDVLRQTAQLVKADVGLEVAVLEVGGWDHHVAEGGARGQLANRLEELGQGLAAFWQDLGERRAEVVVLTMTEFGRTVRENGNAGTDHGHATVMFVLGGRVRGGRVYGRWPGLAPEQLFEGRDLALTTDFRDLFAEVAVRHLGVPWTAPLFPGYRVQPEAFPGVLPAA